MAFTLLDDEPQSGKFTLLDDEQPEAPPAPVEQRTIPQEIGRQLGLSARAGIRAVTGLPEMVGNALFGLTNLTGITDGPSFRTSRAVDNLLNSIGLPSPETPTERVSGDVATAMGGTGLVSAAGKLAKPVTETAQNVSRLLAQNAPAQIASSGTGTASSSTAREMGAPVPVQIGASVLGGYAPRVVAPKTMGLMDPPQGPVSQTAAQKNIEAFKESGTTASAGQATGSNFYRALENLAAKFPGGQAVIKRFRDNQQKEMGDRVRTGVSAERAGKTVEQGITGSGGFLERTSAQWKQLDDKLMSQVGQNTMVAPRKTMSTLESLASRVDEPSINRVLASPKIVELLNALKKGTGATDTKTVFGAEWSMPTTTTGTPGMLPFSTLRAIRSEIGRMMDQNTLTSDFKQGELKALYGALSDDIRVAAERSGKSSLHTWNMQNKLWLGRQDRAEGVLQRVIGDNKDPEHIIKALTPTSPDQMTTIRTVMKSLRPEERQMVSDALVHRLGRALPGKQDDVGSIFSSETFLTNYSKLSPEAKAVMFPNMTQRKGIEAVAKAASAIRDSNQAFANPSGTAGAAAPYVLGGMVFGGGVTGALTAGAMVAGSAIGAKMLTNPKVVAWLAQGTKIKPTEMASHLSRLERIYSGSKDEALRQEITDYMQAIGTQQ